MPISQENLSLQMKAWTKGKKAEIFKIYDHLHNMPELGMEEIKTSSYIKSYLENQGFQVVSAIGKTGLVSYIKGEKPGPVIGLRVDMDALGHMVDGEIKAIHSCGHDAHSTMGIFAGILLKELKLIKRGALKLIFQPAEETDKGARVMVEDGVVDDVDMCIGIHLRPIQEAKLGEGSPALWHGYNSFIHASIMGESAHGARPHLGKNVIDAAASIINAVNAIHVDPSTPASVKVTAVRAGGGAFNAIPDRADIVLDFRAQKGEIMEELIMKGKNAITMGAACVDCTGKIEMEVKHPGADYDRKMIEIAGNSIKEIMGEKGLIAEIVTPGGEDFHYFKKAKPTLKTVYLGLGADLKPGLHHPQMSFNKEAILDGVNILSNMVHKLLG